MSPKLQEIASRLEDARMHLEFAQNYVQEVLTDRVGGPDGDYAYRRAIKAETAALRNYFSVRREYEECLRRQAQLSKGQGA